MNRLRFLSPAVILMPLVAALTVMPGRAGDTAAPAVADSPAAHAFETAPVRIFPSIDSLTRLDMLDYYRAGMDKPSKNAFNGHARVTDLNASQITVETSEAAEKTINLIPRGKNDTIIMLITTVKTPAEDSSVRFYTRDWKPIDKGLFMVPALDSWLTPEGQSNRETLEDAVPYMLAKITYEPEGRRLTLTNNLGDYLPEEVKDIAGNSLRGSLTFYWDGHKMVAEK